MRFTDGFWHVVLEGGGGLYAYVLAHVPLPWTLC